MAGSGGVEPNFNDMQWKLFEKQFLETEEPLGYKSTSGQMADEILFVRLCDDLKKKECTLAQLQIKEFGTALRDGLGMGSLSSDDVQVCVCCVCVCLCVSVCVCVSVSVSVTLCVTSSDDVQV